MIAGLVYLLFALPLASALDPVAPHAGAPLVPVPVVTAAACLPAVVAGALAGLAVRMWPVRRGPPLPRLVRLGQGVGFRPLGEGLPGVGEGASIWVVPPADQAAFVAGLARALSLRGPVLLLARPDTRRAHWDRFGPGHAPVWMAEQERPSAQRALAAAAGLAADGRSAAIVVEGTEAMEPVAGGLSTAALDELLAGSALPVIVVIAAGDPLPRTARPRVTLTATPAGWRSDGGIALTTVDGWIEREPG